METLIWVGIVAAIAGLAYVFLQGNVTKQEVDQVVGDVKEAIDDAKETVEDVVEEIQEVVEEVKEEVKATVEKVTPKPKLPTNKELEKKTKTELEKFGRDVGIELDKRMTKVNMIADLRAKYKKL